MSSTGPLSLSLAGIAGLGHQGAPPGAQHGLCLGSQAGSDDPCNHGAPPGAELSLCLISRAGSATTSHRGEPPGAHSQLLPRLSVRHLWPGPRGGSTSSTAQPLPDPWFMSAGSSHHRAPLRAQHSICLGTQASVVGPGHQGTPSGPRNTFASAPKPALPALATMGSLRGHISAFTKASRMVLLALATTGSHFWPSQVIAW